VEECGKSRVLIGGLAEELHRRNLRALYRQMYGKLPLPPMTKITRITKKRTKRNKYFLRWMGLSRRLGFGFLLASTQTHQPLFAFDQALDVWA